jgi:hypothetical protein
MVLVQRHPLVVEVVDQVTLVVMVWVVVVDQVLLWLDTK